MEKQERKFKIGDKVTYHDKGIFEIVELGEFTGTRFGTLEYSYRIKYYASKYGRVKKQRVFYNVLERQIHLAIDMVNYLKTKIETKFLSKYEEQVFNLNKFVNIEAGRIDDTKNLKEKLLHAFYKKDCCWTNLDDFYLEFLDKYSIRESSLSKKKLKSEILKLKEEGFIILSPIYSFENGLLAGSGYIINEKGKKEVKKIYNLKD